MGSAAPRLDRVRLRWIIPAEAGIRLTSVIPVLPAAQCRGMMSARTGSLWPARARRQRGEGMRTEIHRLPGAITSCYLIKERGLILVDAGPPQKAEQLLKSLRPLSVDPRDISLVVLTHAHWDHICALTEWKRLSGCKVAVNHREKEWVEKALKPLPRVLNIWGISMALFTRMLARLHPFGGSPVDIALDDSGTSLEPFGVSGRVLHTPGHTPGSMSVLLDTGDAFVGDLAMNGFPARPGPGMPTLGDDPDVVKTSWRLLLDSGAKRIYPAHGKSFDADVLRRKL